MLFYALGHPSSSFVFLVFSHLSIPRRETASRWTKWHIQFGELVVGQGIGNEWHGTVCKHGNLLQEVWAREKGWWQDMNLATGGYGWAHVQSSRVASTKISTCNALPYVPCTNRIQSFFMLVLQFVRDLLPYESVGIALSLTVARCGWIRRNKTRTAAQLNIQL